MLLLLLLLALLLLVVLPLSRFGLLSEFEVKKGTFSDELFKRGDSCIEGLLLLLLFLLLLLLLLSGGLRSIILLSVPVVGVEGLPIILLLLFFRCSIMEFGLWGL